MYIFLELSWFFIKNIDENLKVVKKFFPLIGKVILQQSFFAFTILEIQDQVSQEFNMRMLHIGCYSNQSACRKLTSIKLIYNKLIYNNVYV